MINAMTLSTSKHYTAWQLIKAYWCSEQRFFAYILFAAVMVMTGSLVGLELAFNYWHNYFYNALQAYNQSAVIRLLGVFCLLAVGSLLLAVYRFYLSQLLGLHWRRWLTYQFIGRWLRNRSYYYLENFDAQTDNPDQRIQEDIEYLINYSIDLFIGLVSSITTFFAFIYVLWQLSGHLAISFGHLGVLHIAGYLVWVAVIYTVIGTVFAFLIGHPLIFLNFEQQRREATFRFAAVDLRSHAEHVALYRGEQHQKSILKKLINKVLENYYLIILRQKILLWFTAGYNQISVLLPLVVALPNYFKKVFLLGGFMQTLQAFGRVQESLSFLVGAYPQIAQWRAVVQRLLTFLNHMSAIEQEASKQYHLFLHHHADDNIVIKQLTISTPAGQQLLTNINALFIHGQHYLITGKSGIGKSTFLRTLAGIWPYASGEIILPNKLVMYLPQKPYMPIGTLAEAVLFPDHAQPHLVQRLETVLRVCQLEKFIPLLPETASWSAQLSLGEQQRIAFARILLHEPAWVFLDESTSMLDLAGEKTLYTLLKSTLPTCSLVSVSHHPSVSSFHDHTIDMEQYIV